MKTNLITMAVSAIVLAFTLLFSQTLLAEPSAYTRYYVSSLLAISGGVLVIGGLRLLARGLRRSSLSGGESVQRLDQRREHFRLSFESSALPLFMQVGEPHSAGVFTCPVSDLSETGLSLRCAGVYACGQTVIGEIIFPSGRRVQVNGQVIREESDRTILSLHCTVDPTVFMAEQREWVESQKDAGPRPAVSRGALEEPRTSLPSHRPKGLCRLK